MGCERGFSVCFFSPRTSGSTFKNEAMWKWWSHSLSSSRRELTAWENQRGSLEARGSAVDSPVSFSREVCEHSQNSLQRPFLRLLVNLSGGKEAMHTHTHTHSHALVLTCTSTPMASHRDLTGLSICGERGGEAEKWGGTDGFQAKSGRIRGAEVTPHPGSHSAPKPSLWSPTWFQSTQLSTLQPSRFLYLHVHIQLKPKEPRANSHPAAIL